jgi:hypothetical protein
MSSRSLALLMRQQLRSTHGANVVEEFKGGYSWVAAIVASWR